MKKLPSLQEDFSSWYQEVIIAAELVDQAETKGCFVIRPYAYALWENVVARLDERIKAEGVENAYFPLLIPESFLKKEADHVEGFAPELAVVTHGGGKQLEEPLVVRPTSETMFYSMFARWIHSWRDLPVKINQWANVVRWEMRTRPFLRTLEFLWQEGHTAHATHEEAVEMATTMLNHYKELYEKYLAIPVFNGIKSDSERFAGAERTYTIEGIMPDGKALQMCTSHVLAHSFPEAFDIRFQDRDGTMQTPFCTSWGFTTRAIGALIMVHGDEQGLILPPKIAATKIVIVTIYKNEEEKKLVSDAASSLRERLLSALKQKQEDSFICRESELIKAVVIDDNDQLSPGARFYHWELRGVPVRIEIGPRDLANNNVTLVNRLEQDKNKKKEVVSLDTAEIQCLRLLSRIQRDLYARALDRTQGHLHYQEKLTDFGQQLDLHNGVYQVGWCQSPACEEQLKQYKGSIRCLLETKEHSSCFGCSQASKQDVLVAKSY